MLHYAPPLVPCKLGVKTQLRLDNNLALVRVATPASSKSKPRPFLDRFKRAGATSSTSSVRTPMSAPHVLTGIAPMAFWHQGRHFWLPKVSCTSHASSPSRSGSSLSPPSLAGASAMAGSALCISAKGATFRTPIKSIVFLS
jgi:hypothetical protein